MQRSGSGARILEARLGFKPRSLRRILDRRRPRVPSVDRAMVASTRLRGSVPAARLGCAGKSGPDGEMPAWLCRRGRSQSGAGDGRPNRPRSGPATCSGPDQKGTRTIQGQTWGPRCGCGEESLKKGTGGCRLEDRGSLPLPPGRLTAADLPSILFP